MVILHKEECNIQNAYCLENYSLNYIFLSKFVKIIRFFMHLGKSEMWIFITSFVNIHQLATLGYIQ
jgi:hypothetical protein